MRRFLFLILAAGLGFWAGKASERALLPPCLPSCSVFSELRMPPAPRKSFVIVIYAYNQEAWCERALRSVFAQDYETYRVIVVNDASTDQTEGKAKEFILENSQEAKVILMTNETRLGVARSLQRAVRSCSDAEIVIPLMAKDWLASDLVLKTLNQVYPCSDPGLVLGSSIIYPSYEIQHEMQVACSAKLWKEALAGQESLLVGSDLSAWVLYLKKKGKGKMTVFKEPLSFSNRAPGAREGWAL